MNLEPSEFDIERVILDYLSRLRGGFVTKINIGGKPIKTKFGIVMAPYGSKFARKGVSDIQFVFRGTFFAFEVKTPKEHKYILKHYAKLSMINPKTEKNKKYKHLNSQIDYISGVKSAGGHGHFVSSLEQVKSILNAFIKV